MRLSSGIHVPDYYRRDRRIEIIDPLKMPPLPDVGRMPAVIPQRCGIAFVGGVSAGGQNAVTTAGLAGASAANFVFIFTAYFSAPTVTDSNTNTYTALGTTASAGGDPVVKGWYSQGGSYTDNMTFSTVGSGTFSGIVAMAFSGVKATPLDTESAGGNVNTGTTVQPGTQTPSENNCILITGMGINANDGVPTIDGGFSVLSAGASYIAFGGSYYGTCVSYLIQTTAAAANPTWTNAATRKMATIMASFKAAAAGGGGFGRPLAGSRNNPIGLV